MSSRDSPRAIISTCVQYSNWLISPASASLGSCSAASHTSPASSRIFLPSPCMPPSSAATVALPAGRVRARSPSSANRSSKVFTASDCFTRRRAKSRRFSSAELHVEVLGLGMVQDEGVGRLLGMQLQLVGQRHADPFGLEQLHHLHPVLQVGAGAITEGKAGAAIAELEVVLDGLGVLGRHRPVPGEPELLADAFVPVLGKRL